jgi:hypothetical protein
VYNPAYRYEKAMSVRAPDGDSSAGLVLQWYLMCSYLYYQLNRSVVPDVLFDFWSELLLYEWDDFEHPHKHLVNMDDLEAGTGHAIKYPRMVIGAAEALLKREVELPDLEKL